MGGGGEDSPLRVGTEYNLVPFSVKPLELMNCHHTCTAVAMET
jgi:hypothetical protein